MFPIRVVLPNSLAFAMQHCLPSVSSNRRFYLYLDHRTVPPAVVLIFLAAGVLDTSDVQAGILGANGIKPIDIMALFLSLVYHPIVVHDRNRCPTEKLFRRTWLSHWMLPGSYVF